MNYVQMPYQTITNMDIMRELKQIEKTLKKFEEILNNINTNNNSTYLKKDDNYYMI